MSCANLKSNASVQKRGCDDVQKQLETLLQSCLERRLDWGTVAFMAYDTCNTATSPVRNCEAGAALYHGVLGPVLNIPLLEDTDMAIQFRNALRQRLPSMMRDNMKFWLQHHATHSKNRREQEFMTDVLPNAIGTHVRRDPALEIVRAKWDSAGIGEFFVLVLCNFCVLIMFLCWAGEWGRVRFPIVFHLQWDPKKPNDKKEKMLFHVTFHPWATCVFLAQSICSNTPPVQIRETPFKDGNTKCMYQSPRKYVIDWDLYLEENLGGAGPMNVFTLSYLAKNMFVRALGVLHAYMRQMNVLPGKKELCVSIKSRTRRALNKHGNGLNFIQNLCPSMPQTHL